MNQIVDGIKERVNNSVSGAFTLLFTFFNWEIVLHATTGSSPAIERISNIQTYLLKTEGVLWKPILATIIYLFAMPVFISLVEYWNKRVELKKLNKIEEYTLAESKLWAPSFEIVKHIGKRCVDLVNNYESNKTAHGDNLKIIRTYLSVIAHDNPKTINDEYNKLKIDRKI